MTYSGSSRPDLDWSQVRETIKLLAVTVAQVEGSMKQGDESVNTLTGSFTAMVEHMQNIHQLLAGFEDSETKLAALMHCEAATASFQSSIIAFQFYDRLQQCLAHVTSGLRGVSELIENPARLYNPAEWYAFQSQIRSRYTMESEKAMFDAILQGKSIDEALKIAENFEQDAEDDVELF